jgi:predicted dithiol-disulfide oxidoreductase (DUF899 family)
MTEHKVGTREEWQAARDELAGLEAEHAELGRRLAEQRRELPWVPVEKEYEFDTAEGKKTLAELFDGRSQLLAYNIMLGPDFEFGACPGCSNLGDELDGTRVHLNHRDVTLICFSRALSSGWPPTGSGWAGRSRTPRPTGPTSPSTSGSL